MPDREVAARTGNSLRSTDAVLQGRLGGIRRRSGTASSLLRTCSMAGYSLNTPCLTFGEPIGTDDLYEKERRAELSLSPILPSASLLHGPVGGVRGPREGRHRLGSEARDPRVLSFPGGLFPATGPRALRGFPAFSRGPSRRRAAAPRNDETTGPAPSRNQTVSTGVCMRPGPAERGITCPLQQPPWCDSLRCPGRPRRHTPWRMR